MLIQIETGDNPGVKFKTHPNINRDLYNGENILGLRDPNRPFPSGPGSEGVSLLKWRMQSADESLAPLSSKLFLYITQALKTLERCVIL